VNPIRNKTLRLACLVVAVAATDIAWAQATPFDVPSPAARPADPAPSAAAAAMPPAPAPAPAPRPARQARTATHVGNEVRAVNQSYSGETPLSCRSINWKKGDIVRLQAQPYKQVHVSLPERGIDVIMGDKELWALDWINSQIFIKPTSHASEGRSTTITAIGQSGNAYEFVVERVADRAEVAHCVYINGDSSLISRTAWAQAAERNSDASLVREVAGLREQNATMERQARENMKAYRRKLNSNYSWRSGVFSRWNGGEVESVYDDGRFTYVRLKEDSQGLLAITGEVEGKPMMLEYSYDSPSRTYQISGLFPKLTLRSGEQALAITRTRTAE